MYSVDFFFQAEDGIRDLVRSRGLGDVYKRQVAHRLPASNSVGVSATIPQPIGFNLSINIKNVWSVSYTHLTLPTSDLV